MASVIHAIPVVTPEATGVHLLWNGPREWIYSPGGWRLQRRELDRRRDVECVQIAGATLPQLRDARELRTAIGLALVRAGVWPASAAPGAPQAGSVAEVFTLELDRPASYVRVISSAKWNFVVVKASWRVHDNTVIWTCALWSSEHRRHRGGSSGNCPYRRTFYAVVCEPSAPAVLRF